jgi:hypothetical protein
MDPIPRPGILSPYPTPGIHLGNVLRAVLELVRAVDRMPTWLRHGRRFSDNMISLFSERRLFQMEWVAG